MVGLFMNMLRLAACGIDYKEYGSYKVTMYQDLTAAEMLVEWHKSNGWIKKDELPKRWWN